MSCSKIKKFGAHSFPAYNWLGSEWSVELFFLV